MKKSYLVGIMIIVYSGGMKRFGPVRANPFLDSEPVVNVT